MLAVLLAFAPVGAARAAVPGIYDDQFFRVSTDAEARAGLVEASGARVARVDVRWSTVAPSRPRAQTDPSDPAYRFDPLDRVVAALSSRGITPLFTVYATPRWAARSRTAPGPSGAPRPAQFARFMQALAHRYSGRFVDIQKGTIPRVRHYEIWNEPNSARFLKPQRRGKRTLSLSAYVALTRGAYPRIKKVNPRAVVIAGSTAPRSRTNRSAIAAREWLQGLARSAAKFDAYSMHLHSSRAPRSKGAPYLHWSSLTKITAELDAIERRKGVPVYITGAGYSTAGVSAARQALYLRQIFALPSVRSERVPLVVWSNLQDSPARATGLLFVDGSHKSSFAKFVGETRRRSVLPQALRR